LACPEAASVSASTLGKFKDKGGATSSPVSVAPAIGLAISGNFPRLNGRSANSLCSSEIISQLRKTSLQHHRK